MQRVAAATRATVLQTPSVAKLWSVGVGYLVISSAATVAAFAAVFAIIGAVLLIIGVCVAIAAV